MITPGLSNSLEHIVEEIYFAGAGGESPLEDVKRDRLAELSVLIKSEAINLGEKMIGKEKILHDLTDENGNTFLDPSEVAVRDFQVAQRLVIADYQKPHTPQIGITGPEEINEELSENEA